MQVIRTRTSAYLKHIKPIILWVFNLMELWLPMFFAVNYTFLKEMYCAWIKPPYTEVGIWSMMSVLLCSFGISGSHQTLLLRPVRVLKSWAGNVVSG